MTNRRLVGRGYGVLVDLDADDEAIAARLFVQAVDAEQFVPMRSTDPQRRLDAWRAEVAGARVFGADPATLTCDADAGVDLRVGPRTVQIKFNPYPHGDLYAPPWGPFRADVLVLVRPDLLVGGWVPRHVFEVQAHALPWPTMDGRPALGLTPDELWPLELLPIARAR